MSDTGSRTDRGLNTSSKAETTNTSDIRNIRVGDRVCLRDCSPENPFVIVGIVANPPHLKGLDQYVVRDQRGVDRLIERCVIARMYDIEPDPLEVDKPTQLNSENSPERVVGEEGQDPLRPAGTSPGGPGEAEEMNSEKSPERVCL
ncbi:hypothetical protein COB72_08990, partial [bacterium]